MQIRVNTATKELSFAGSDVTTTDGAQEDLVWYGGTGRTAQVARTVTRVFAGSSVIWAGLGVDRDGGLEFSVETEGLGEFSLVPDSGITICYRPLPPEYRAVLEEQVAKGLVLSQVIGTGGADIFTEMVTERAGWGLLGLARQTV